MEKITQLIKSLSRDEIGLVKRFYASTKNKELLLRNKLLDIIIDGAQSTSDQIANKLNKKPKDPAFLMLKARLQDDILRVLVAKDFSNKYTSKYYKARYQCRVMLLEIDILIFKSANLLATELLNKVEKLANKYDLTEEKIIANSFKYMLLGLKVGLPVYKKIASDNMKNFDDIKLNFIAQDYFRKLTMPNLLVANKEVHFKQQAYEATEQLKKMSDETALPRITFFYLRSEIYYHHLINDYSNALKYALQFLNFIENNHIMNSSDNLAGAYMMLANLNVFMDNAEEAIKFGEAGLPYFHSGSANQIGIYDILIVAALKNKNFEYANQLLQIVKSFQIMKTHHFFRSKWVYFEANLRFLEGRYDMALAILQKQSELISDKSGWRLGYKILEMMCIIELGNYDWLDYRIETFRKLLSTVKKENIQRPKVVMQIIKQFIKSAYNFKTTTQKMYEQLKLLSHADDQYRYDPKGYEVIRFDTWWQSKLATRKRQEY